MLDTLLGELGRNEIALPESVKAIMAQASHTTAQGEAKVLHKLVSQRKNAVTMLQSIRHQRETFEAGWAKYTQSLLDTVSKQLQEREDALLHFDEAEKEWSMLHKDTNQQLKLATGHEGQEIDAKTDEMEDVEEEVADIAQRDAQIANRREQMMTQHQKMRKALEAVRDTALQGADREHSRTPRRKGREQDAESISSADLPKDGGGHAGGPNSQAPTSAATQKEAPAANKAGQPFQAAHC